MKDHDTRDTNRDRDLLLGVMAVQLGFISADDLAKVAQAWAAETDKGLADILLESGNLDAAKLESLEKQLDAKIEEHQGDIGETLASFGGDGAIDASFGGTMLFGDDNNDADGTYIGDPPDTVPPGPDPARTDPAGAAGGTHPEHISRYLRQAGLLLGRSIEESDKITLEHPGRYTIKSEHGRGAIGRVLVAFDEHIGREVALKELLPEGGPAGSSGPSQSPVRVTAQAAARFLREARITGQLEHPGIVPVYEIARRDDGSSYYTMKLVRGKTMAARLKECGGLRERLRLLPNYLDLCQAMAYAHSRGVVHRDLKPANIMLGEFGETVVLDWGLAKIRGLEDERADDLAESLRLIKDAQAGETVKGVPIGTPAYMSPEQAVGKIEDVDERSDVFSLGVILYEVLAGRPPFKGNTAWEVMGRVIKDEVPPVREIEPKAPPELVAIAEKCLNKDRPERYADAGELAEDVANFQSGGLVSSFEYSVSALAARWVRLHKKALALVCLLVFAVAGTGAGIEAKKRLVARGALDLSDKAREYGEAHNHNGALMQLSALLALDGYDNPETWGRYFKNLRGNTELVKWSKPSEFLFFPVRLSPGGDMLACKVCDKIVANYDCGEASLIVRDLSTGQILRRHELNEDDWPVSDFSQVAVGPGGSPFYVLFSSYREDDDKSHIGGVIGEDGSVGEIRIEGFFADDIRVSPDGKKLFLVGSAGKDDGPKKVYILDAETLEKLDEFSPQDQLTAISFPMAMSPDGRCLAHPTKEFRLAIRDLAAGSNKLELAGHTSKINKIFWSGDGRRVGSVSYDNSLRIWDAETGEPAAALAMTRVFTGAMSGDGKIAALAGTDKNTNDIVGLDPYLAIHRVSDGALLRRAPLPGYTEWISFIDGGARLAAYNVTPEPPYDQNFLVFDMSRVAEPVTMGGRSDPIVKLIFDPAGERMVAQKSNRAIQVLREADGSLLASIPETHKKHISEMAVSPDGRYLATGGCDLGDCDLGRIKIWDMETGSLARTLAGHRGSIGKIVFDKDSRLLASSGNDLVKLWDLETGGLVASVSGSIPVFFSDDGRSLCFVQKRKRPKKREMTAAEKRAEERNKVLATGAYWLGFGPAEGGPAQGDSAEGDSARGKPVRAWNTEIREAPEMKELLAPEIVADRKKKLAFATDSGNLRSVSLDTGKKVSAANPYNERDKWPEHYRSDMKGGYIEHVAPAPNADILVTASGEKMSVWDGEGKALKNILAPREEGINWLAAHPSGDYAVAGYYDKQAVFVSLKSRDEIGPQNVAAHTADICGAYLEADAAEKYKFIVTDWAYLFYAQNLNASDDDKIVIGILFSIALLVLAQKIVRALLLRRRKDIVAETKSAPGILTLAAYYLQLVALGLVIALILAVTFVAWKGGMPPTPGLAMALAWLAPLLLRVGASPRYRVALGAERLYTTRLLRPRRVRTGKIRSARALEIKRWYLRAPPALVFIALGRSLPNLIVGHGRFGFSFLNVESPGLFAREILDARERSAGREIKGGVAGAKELMGKRWARAVAALLAVAALVTAWQYMTFKSELETTVDALKTYQSRVEERTRYAHQILKHVEGVAGVYQAAKDAAEREDEILSDHARLLERVPAEADPAAFINSERQRAAELGLDLRARQVARSSSGGIGSAQIELTIAGKPSAIREYVDDFAMVPRLVELVWAEPAEGGVTLAAVIYNLEMDLAADGQAFEAPPPIEVSVEPCPPLPDKKTWMPPYESEIQYLRDRYAKACARREQIGAAVAKANDKIAEMGKDPVTGEQMRLLSMSDANGLIEEKVMEVWRANSIFVLPEFGLSAKREEAIWNVAPDPSDGRRLEDTDDR